MNRRTAEQTPRSHRSIIALALALALLTAMAVLASGVLAGTPQTADSSAAPAGQALLQEPTIPSPTIPPEPGALETMVTGGPDPFCPGWRLHYRLIVTNTGSISLDDLGVTAYLPAMVYNVVDGGSTTPGTYNAPTNTMEWALDSLMPDDVMEAYVILNTFSSVAPGSVLSTTFVISSPMLAEERIAAIGFVANSQVCDKTATPTPTTKPSETPTPTATATLTPSPTNTPVLTPPMYLPLVMHMWTGPR